jgi:uncharacterized protein with HEPN domain
MRDEDRDPERLELILRLIGAIHRRLSAIDLEAFRLSEDEIDLTSYRLAMIGKVTSKLSQSLKERHALPWPAICGLRNIVVHNYLGIEPTRIWIAATEHLGDLASVCRVELSRIDTP